MSDQVNLSSLAVQKEKLLYLESLRGIAALTVVLLHARTFARDSLLLSNPFVMNGGLMVDFFFVLSGFVIAYNYSDRLSSISSFVGFQTKRFLRLYPLHLLTLIAFVGLGIVKIIFVKITGATPANAAFSISDFGAFVNNLFLTQAFFESEFTFNGPSWSISSEFYTYAVFAGVLLAVSKGWRVFAYFCVVALSALVIIVFRPPTTGTIWVLFTCTYSFFLGALTYVLYSKIKPKIPSWLAYIALILAIVSVCYGDTLDHLVHPFIFAFLMLALLWGGDSHLKHYLNSKALVFLGTVSYGIYMIHTVVWYVLKQVLGQVFGLTTMMDLGEGLEKKVVVSEPIGTALVFLGIVLIIFLAYLSHRFVEMPFNRMGKNIKVR